MSEDVNVGIERAISIAAGALIIVSSLFLMFMILLGYWNFEGFMDYHEYMMGYAFPNLMMAAMSILGLASGIVVLVCGAMVGRQGVSNNTMGVLILVFSIIGFVGLGGFIIGSVLGIVGGALLISK